MDLSPVMRVAVGADPNSMLVSAGGSRAQAQDHHTIQLRWDAQHAGAASEAAGRPVYDRVLIVRLFYTGTQDTLDVELKRFPSDGGSPVVTDAKRVELYGAAVRQFEANGEALTTGTPLAVINLDPATVANLGALNIGTVEQLAEVPDSALDALRAGGRGFRERARAYLEATNGAAPLAKIAAENESLRADLAETQQQLAELVADSKAAKAAAKAAKAAAAQPTEGA